MKICSVLANKLKRYFWWKKKIVLSVSRFVPLSIVSQAETVIILIIERFCWRKKGDERGDEGVSAVDDDDRSSFFSLHACVTLCVALRGWNW